jgi:hypothetical protein
MRNTALFILLAAGCTRPSTGGLPYLDGAVQVTAQGTRPRSMLTLSRGGALDPTAASVEVMVNDASLVLHVRDGRATLDRIQLTLDDLQLPPSPDLPNGLELRDNSLELDGPLAAVIEEAQPDALTLRAHSRLSVRSKLVLPDGSLYPLGATASEDGDLNVRVTLDGQKAIATLDAAPPATCWSVGTPEATLLSAQNCAVFVESFAQVEAL